MNSRPTTAKSTISSKPPSLASFNRTVRLRKGKRLRVRELRMLLDSPNVDISLETPKMNHRFESPTQELTLQVPRVDLTFATTGTTEKTPNSFERSSRTFKEALPKYANMIKTYTNLKLAHSGDRPMSERARPRSRGTPTLKRINIG